VEDVNCILCGTASDYVLIEQDGYKVRKCPQCGLFYVSPRPSVEEIAALYENDSANITAASHISGATSKKINAKHHLRILRSFVKGGDLLEIGAGAGYFLDEARRVGYSPFGLELNPIQVKYIRDRFNIDCEQSNIGPGIFGGRKFDIVYHCDVLSHFYDPIKEFRKMREIMRPGAILAFETGYVGDEKHLRYIRSLQLPDHLYFFSENNLKQLLGMTGFKLIKIYRYSLLPQIILLRRLNSIIGRTEKHAEESKEADKVTSDACVVSRQSGTKTADQKTLPKRILGYGYRLFRHVLRYKVGRISPKRGRPQTFIVFAIRE
jgi:SAM-dependent methyltransferase